MLRAILRRLEGLGQALRRRETRAPVSRSWPTRRPETGRAVGLCLRRPGPGAMPERPGVAYVYAARPASTKHPPAHVAGFARDASRWMATAAYKALAEGDAVTLAFCWAHALTKLLRACRPRTPAPIAVEALARFDSLLRHRTRYPGARSFSEARRPRPSLGARARSSRPMKRPEFRGQARRCLRRNRNSPRRSATRSRAGRA